MFVRCRVQSAEFRVQSNVLCAYYPEPLAVDTDNLTTLYYELSNGVDTLPPGVWSFHTHSQERKGKKESHEKMHADEKRTWPYLRQSGFSCLASGRVVRMSRPEVGSAPAFSTLGCEPSTLDEDNTYSRLQG
ncbi:hypothetical protein VNO78_22592 [Psophocarpus tetragonolobus]|uniref:Uncharacterized protein n=1 Tax=Psophocarpus tetragonolobus TaxID=3891 RepID=A0AAN9S1V9_PSOTE